MAYQPSKQEIVKEILKSGKDPVYFINNYCRISHPMKGLISFKTYPYQDDLLRDLFNYNGDINDLTKYFEKYRLFLLKSSLNLFTKGVIKPDF